MSTTKYCSGCDRRRRVKFFSKNAARYDGMATYCKPCQLTRTMDHYRENKKSYTDRVKSRKKMLLEFIRSLKSAPCTDCKVSYIPEVMEFDHVRGIKVETLSRLHGRGSMALVKAELAKCELVCSNCHRIRTVNRRKI